jgi:hypothetical protein
MDALNKASRDWVGWRAIHEGLKQGRVWYDQPDKYASLSGSSGERTA